MNELYKRIKERREELRLTQEELAQKLGYKSRSSINKIESGENDIPQSKIEAFAKALDTTPAYLMGWEDMRGVVLDGVNPEGRSIEGLYYKIYNEEIGKPVIKIHVPENLKREDLDNILIAKHAAHDLTDALKLGAEILIDGNEVPLSAESPENVLVPIHYKKQIPILGRISAGLPVLAIEHIEGYENVEDESLDYGLVVKGDSMIGARIFEDDVVYVTREVDVCNGDIVIALINGDDATIKRFYKYENEIILKPENPTMKEQHYKPEEVQILGKVKEAKIKLK